jgi:hypothetical protein
VVRMLTQISVCTGIAGPRVQFLSEGPYIDYIADSLVRSTRNFHLRKSLQQSFIYPLCHFTVLVYFSNRALLLQIKLSGTSI